jgi:Ferritin-like
MTRSIDRKNDEQRKSSRVRVMSVQQTPDPTRRELLRAGVALPAAWLAGGCVRAESTVQPAPNSNAQERHLVRHFADPYIELVRLLHEASEIEHSLMVQYLYAAFSVKAQYQQIAGYGAPSSNDLMGVAIQEMQHLSKVNRLLVALGASPTLVREDFPYEPEIYPFQFSLEPLSRNSLAKYVYCEAPADAVDLRYAKTAAEAEFRALLATTLGSGTRPNFIGSLYAAVIALIEETAATHDAALPDLKPWVKVMDEIKDEGEHGHFQFFKRVFLGTHEGFKGRENVWRRAPSDALYPSHPLPHDPSAYVGHDHQLQDPQARQLAWLGNLHYWVLLCLLDAGYRYGSPEHSALARAHMLGPFWSLARHLAKLGVGMPFDPLSVGYAPGRDRNESRRFVEHLLNEADQLEQGIHADLPADFPRQSCRSTLAAIAHPEPKLTYDVRQPWDSDWA